MWRIAVESDTCPPIPTQYLSCSSFQQSAREMERSMPEVWNIFSMPGNRPPPQQHHYHPVTANNRRHHHSHTSVVAQMHYPTAATSRPMQHYNWPRQSQEVLMCWSDRSVP